MIRLCLALALVSCNQAKPPPPPPPKAQPIAVAPPDLAPALRIAPLPPNLVQLADAGNWPADLALAGDDLVWSGWDAMPAEFVIYAVARAGGPRRTLATGIPRLSSLAGTDHHVYFTSLDRGIERVALAGGPVEKVLDARLPHNLVIAGGTLLWDAEGVVYSRLSSGGNTRRLYKAPRGVLIENLASDGRYAYVATMEPKQILRVLLSGGIVDKIADNGRYASVKHTVLAMNGTSSLAFIGSTAFWVSTGAMHGEVRSAPLDAPAERHDGGEVVVREWDYWPTELVSDGRDLFVLSRKQLLVDIPSDTPARVARLLRAEVDGGL